VAFYEHHSSLVRGFQTVNDPPMAVATLSSADYFEAIINAPVPGPLDFSLSHSSHAFVTTYLPKAVSKSPLATTSRPRAKVLSTPEGIISQFKLCVTKMSRSIPVCLAVGIEIMGKAPALLMIAAIALFHVGLVTALILSSYSPYPSCFDVFPGPV
jgi:hypothetical protein